MQRIFDLDSIFVQYMGVIIPIHHSNYKTEYIRELGYL